MEQEQNDHWQDLEPETENKQQPETEQDMGMDQGTC